MIYEVLFCLKKEYVNYKKFKNNKNCLFIENEDFVEMICKFLNTKKSKFKKIMKN